MRLAWLPHSHNPIYAGVRLRCLIPHAVMQGKGLHSRVATDGDDLAGADVIVVQAKWLLDASTPWMLERRMAQLDRARAAGSKLVLDSFDNYFVNTGADPHRAALLDSYRCCLTRFDRYVTSSPGLVPLLREDLRPDAVVEVVGDPVDGPDSHLLFESLALRWNPLRWRSHLQHWLRNRSLGRQRRDTRQLLWYGSHGSHYAPGGMNELSRILPRLAAVARRQKIHLTVISNSRQHYERLLRGYQLPSSYLNWSRLHFASSLRHYDLVVLPSEVNSFTMAKSSNRLILPLSQGVPVMADALPDYLAWRDYCAIDAWDSLDEHLKDPSTLRARALGAVAPILAQHAPSAIARRWLEVLEAA